MNGLIFGFKISGCFGELNSIQSSISHLRIPLPFAPLTKFWPEKLKNTIVKMQQNEIDDAKPLFSNS